MTTIAPPTIELPGPDVIESEFLARGLWHALKSARVHRWPEPCSDREPPYFGFVGPIHDDHHRAIGLIVWRRRSAAVVCAPGGLTTYWDDVEVHALWAPESERDRGLAEGARTLAAEAPVPCSCEADELPAGCLQCRCAWCQRLPEGLLRAPWAHFDATRECAHSRADIEHNPPTSEVVIAELTTDLAKIGATIDRGVAASHGTYPEIVVHGELRRWLADARFALWEQVAIGAATPGRLAALADLLSIRWAEARTRHRALLVLHDRRWPAQRLDEVVAAGPLESWARAHGGLDR